MKSKTVKLKNIADMVQPIKRLMKQEVPVKAAYNIAKNIKKVDEEWSLIVQFGNSLVAKYGKENESGTPEIKSEDVEAIKSYNDEIAQYLETEIELEYYPIPLSDLENCKLSVSDTMALEVLIEE